jgi:hypothetical protein
MMLNMPTSVPEPPTTVAETERDANLSSFDRTQAVVKNLHQMLNIS